MAAKKKYKTPNAKVKYFNDATEGAADAAASAAGQIQLKELFNNLWGGVKAHPWKTGLTGLNAVGNVAGLVDNPNFLGQAAGTAAGALAPTVLNKVLGKTMGKVLPISPLMRANTAMIGGNLGALFDSLRAKKQEEQTMARQYGGGY